MSGVPSVFGGGVVTAQPLVAHASGINLRVTYEPTTHLQEPTTLSLSITSIFGSKGKFSIRAGRVFSDAFLVSRINPEPLSILVGQDETVYMFPPTDNGIVTFTLTPKRIGVTATTLQYDVDPPVGFFMNTVR
ncbi:MAG: hypothetical protein ACYC6X_03385 [Minisyncoccota bacterium]